MSAVPKYVRVLMSIQRWPSSSSVDSVSSSFGTASVAPETPQCEPLLGCPTTTGAAQEVRMCRGLEEITVQPGDDVGSDHLE